MGNFVVYGRLGSDRLPWDCSPVSYHKKRPILGIGIKMSTVTGESNSLGGELIIDGGTLVLPGGMLV